MKLVRNVGQSQRFRFVVLVIGCFLVSMTFIVVSRPQTLSAISSKVLPGTLNSGEDVEKDNSHIRMPEGSSSHSSTSGRDSQTTQPSENKKKEEEEGKPREEERFPTVDPTQEEERHTENNDDQTVKKPDAEEKREEKLEVRPLEDEPHKITLPTVSNYTIDDPVQGEKPTTTPEQSGKDAASVIWNPERKALCDLSDFRVDVCVMNGDIRIPGNSSTVIYTEQGNNNESYVIHPYPRKGDNWCFSRVREVTVKSSNVAPQCTVSHNVPAVVFSNGGYAGNFFHDFTDLLIPLFLTAGPFNGEVKLVVTDFNPYWIFKYLLFFQKLSKYPVIDIEKDKEVHCFKHVIVGVRAHKELSIDPARAPSGYSMVDFTKFLRSAFALPRESMTNIEDRLGKKPRMLLIARKRTRTFTNLYEIIQMADDLGFDVVVNDAELGSDMPKFAELVNSCDVLVGVHGAGLTNAMFLPPNATLIQIVPWGALEAIAMYDFGNPAKDMNLNYMQYSISIEESTLIELYPRDHPVFTDPSQYHNKDFHTLRSTFLDQQNVKLDVRKFRSVLWKALEHIIQ